MCNNCNAIQKIKNIVAIRNALYKRLANKNQRKVINKKMRRFPDILPNERRTWSPTNLSDLRKRMISPVSIRKFKITTDKIVPSSIRLIPDNSIKKLTIDWTEEQTIWVYLKINSYYEKIIINLFNSQLI